MSDENHTESGKKLSTFEKYLPLWVAVCILTGIVLSQIVPVIAT